MAFNKPDVIIACLATAIFLGILALIHVENSSTRKCRLLAATGTQYTPDEIVRICK